MYLTAEEREHWESLGFGMGAKVSPTGLSWNASASSRKWCGAVGEIVPGSRPKSKGISVSFKHKDYHFPEVFVYHPKNLKLMEPKMPTKPKPATVKTFSIKPESSLYKAIRERLEAKDRETLHDRTTKAVEHVEAMLFGGVVVDTAEAEAPKSSPAPWSLDGLVVDPDPKESVGKCGWFWDAGDHVVVRFGVGADPEDSCRRYNSVEDMSWDHFAYIPNFPGAELLKRTTGYKVA